MHACRKLTNVLGSNVRIEQGAQLENCVILDGTRVGSCSRLSGVLAGPHANIGNGIELGPGSVIGGRSVLMQSAECRPGIFSDAEKRESPAGPAP